MPTSKLILMSVFLMICAGCSTEIQPPPPQIVKIKLPAHLLVECREVDKYPLVYTRDIIQRLQDTETALTECKLRVKEIIRYEAENVSLDFVGSSNYIQPK
ncbi:hypothetical protein FLHKCMKP_CDS0098 [Escherichia phage KS_A3]